MVRAFAVAVVGLALCGAEARPVVDASPDRVKYRLTPGVYLMAPGVDGGSWLPTKPAKGLAAFRGRWCARRFGAGADAAARACWS